MKRMWFARRDDALVPVDEEGVRLVRRLEQGECLMLRPMRPRSLAWHRRYWLLITRLAEHIESIDISLDPRHEAWMPIGSAEDLHTALKLITGHCDTHHIRGTPYVLRVPKRTDFESMSADEWAEYYPRVLDAIHERALPQIEVADIEMELARLAS